MSISRQAHLLYEFGPFQVDLANRLLLRDGQPVPLAPKVLDALFILIENQGHILEKEELMNRLWPDCFVEEGNLTQIIFQLRKALGESASRQQYIETIPRRGYRFIAGVRMMNGVIGQGLAQPVGNGQANGEKEATNGEEIFVNDRDEVMAIGQEIVSPAAIAPHPVGVTLARNDQPGINSRRSRLVIAAALLLVVAGALGLARYLQWAPLAGGRAVHFEKMQIRKLTSSGKAGRPALSPDGNYVAYVVDEAGRQSIHVGQVNSTSSAQVVPPAEVDYPGLTFSPDGGFLYYLADEKDAQHGTLYMVPVLGGTPRKVLEQVDSPVTFSPDGRQFAFVRRNVEQKQTFLMTANADGSGERQLAARRMPDIFSIKGAAWSPDSKVIAATAGKTTPGESCMYVVIVNAADGKETRLGSQTWAAVGSVTWLKDGSGLVVTAWHQEWPVYANQLWYLSYPKGEVSRVSKDLSSHERAGIAARADELVTGRTDRISRLWVAPNGDATRARLIRSGYGDNYSEQFGLSWTPDGRLVYGSHASGNTDIWVMDADGTNQKQLTYDARREVFPVVTDDGRYIVFVSKMSGSSYIWRMDADGRNLRQLTHGKVDDSPSLSPDGQWVVYSSYDASDRQTLWKVSIDGGEPVQLTRLIANRPVVSPDGKLIACQYDDEPGKRIVVAVFPFDGGAPVRIFNEMPLPAWGLLRWTPDGRALTYIVTRDGVSNIWLQPVDGGQPKQLTNFMEDQIFRLAWSRDGRQLAFDRGVTIKDVILISDFR